MGPTRVAEFGCPPVSSIERSLPSCASVDAPIRGEHAATIHIGFSASRFRLGQRARTAFPRFSSVPRGQNRTGDTWFFRPLLYRLRYLGGTFILLGNLRHRPPENRAGGLED